MIHYDIYILIYKKLNPLPIPNNLFGGKRKTDFYLYTSSVKFIYFQFQIKKFSLVHSNDLVLFSFGFSASYQIKKITTESQQLAKSTFYWKNHKNQTKPQNLKSSTVSHKNNITIISLKTKKLGLIRAHLITHGLDIVIELLPEISSHHFFFFCSESERERDNSNTRKKY